MTPVKDFSTLVAEQLTNVIMEDERARGLLDTLATSVPETSGKTGKVQPLFLIVVFPERTALLGPEVKPDAGTPAVEGTDAGTAGLTPGAADAGTSGSSSFSGDIHINTGWDVQFFRNADGTLGVRFGSPHVEGKGDVKPKP
jgi:hypothetical protein